MAGAGPAGLSAALAARSLGIDVTVLEAEPEDRARPGSRALFVHHETLERLERISPGLGYQIGEFGIVWQSNRTFYRGREVYTRRYEEMPSQSGLPPYASLRQVDTEQFLREACQAAGVRFAWDTRVTEVGSAPDGVRVRDAHDREWTARYLIGADGARSAVRSALDIVMDGERSEDYRVAVDLAEPEVGRGETADRIMHYRHPAMAGRNLLIVPFAGGVQVDVQSLGAADSDELSTPEAVRRWLPGVIGSGYLDRILWIARYPGLQRVADTFTDPHRRVLLTGEAAHLFVPLGARGMNSAIADAEASAAAVALALRATSEQRASGAIEDYDRTRRLAAHSNRARVDRALRHLRAQTRLARVLQGAAGLVAPFVRPAGAWLDKSPYGPRGTIAVPSGLY